MESLSQQIDRDFERLHLLSRAEPSDARQRRELLNALKSGLLGARDRIHTAVLNDFTKPKAEADLTEIAALLLEMQTALSNLETWMSPARVRAGFPFWGTRSRVITQPKGLVLIISPWNYPVLLALAPVVSALAAGNRIILKPSEHTPHTNATLKEIADASLGADWCVVFEGDVDVGAYLLTKPFDHFFFTGSPEVGRLVGKAAAGHYSSSTLELGGKSPSIVDESADLDLAAEKIIVGKYLNAGQTCIAPDFVLAHEIVFDSLVDRLNEHASQIAATSSSPMTGIIDASHENRLTALWEDARAAGALKQYPGPLDLGKISILTGIPIGSRIMREEIFGPLLPVLRYQSLDEIVGVLDGIGAPLTTYLFTRNSRFASEVTRRIKTGSICQNETLLHFAHPRLPFGGVGKSGSGRTHGHSGFRSFSNEISVLEQRWGRGVLPLIFPDGTTTQRRVRNWLVRYLSR